MLYFFDWKDFYRWNWRQIWSSKWIRDLPSVFYWHRKKRENLNSKIFKTKNDRLIMQSKSTACRFKKSKFVKQQEAKGVLSDLGIKTLLSKITLLNVLF